MQASHTRRANGEGSIYPANDGRLRGAIVIANPLTGQQVRRYVSGRSKAEVARKLAKLRDDAFASLTNKQTGAYLTDWLVGAKRRIRPSTYTESVRHINDYFNPVIGDIPIARLTPADVERAMAKLLERGYSPQTVLHARATLRRALHDALRDGLVLRNAAALARPPRAPRREMRTLTIDEVQQLLRTTAEDPMGPLFAVAVATGLRLGEVLGLRWTDVGDGSVTVRRSLARADGGGWAMAEPKTARSRRTVMLPAVAVEALKHQQERQEADRLAAGSDWQNTTGVVFTDAIGRPLHPSAVSHAFRIAADRIGLTAVRLHDLRHTAASLMLGAGVPLKVVSETLGHSSIAVTADVYVHVSPDLRREVASALDRVLS